MQYHDPLQAAERIHARAWNADGLAELAGGFCFTTMAAMQYLQLQVGPRTAAGQKLNLGIMAFMIGVPLLVKWGLPRFRNRVFAARAGVLVPRQSPLERGWRGRGMALLGALVAAAFAAFILQGGKATPALISAFLGLLCGGMLSSVGFRTGLSRLKAAGLLVAGWCLTAALWVRDLETALILDFGGSGLILMVSGLLGLRSFLREPTHD